MRNQNARPPFIQIPNVNEIKRGDIVVFNRAGSFYTGHIGYADEDYNGSGRINILGQNQGQGTASGTPSNVVNFSIANILGAFRNTNWKPAPQPTPTTKKSHFPWVLYSKKFRNKR